MNLTPQIWMSAYQNRHLYELLIPGTHDSGTEGFPAGSPSRTQYYKINEQLDAGVRFLDMRLAYNSAEDNFHIVHAGDVLSYLNFDTVVKWCADFLAAHPSETILMSIKQEGAKPGPEEAFSQELSRWHDMHAARGDWRSDLWFAAVNTVPTVAQARSRIVLLRRYAVPYNVPNPPLFHGGLDFTIINTQQVGDRLIAQPPNPHPSPNPRPGVFLSFQDEYGKAGDEKKQTIDWMLKLMANNANYLGQNHRWFYNFASTGNPGPLRAANVINPWLEAQLTALTAPIYGVLITDYAQPALWKQIYEINVP